MSWYRLAQAEECFKEKGLLAVQSVGQCLIFSHACNWTVSTLCAGPANLRWMWGLEGPLDIQTLHNYGNSGLTFRAWPGLLWEAAAESQAMPAALAESKGVKKAGHRSSCCSPPLCFRADSIFQTSLHLVPGVGGSSVRGFCRRESEPSSDSRAAPPSQHLLCCSH